MPHTSLDTSDAAELAEMLQFLSDWLAADPPHLDASPTRFVGHPAHDTSQLQADLHRFAFLLGTDNAEHLFGDQTTR
jgi:hypothetical protein